MRGMTKPKPLSKQEAIKLIQANFADIEEGLSMKVKQKNLNKRKRSKVQLTEYMKSNKSTRNLSKTKTKTRDKKRDKKVKDKEEDKSAQNVGKTRKRADVLNTKISRRVFDIPYVLFAEMYPEHKRRKKSDNKEELNLKWKDGVLFRLINQIWVWFETVFQPIFLKEESNTLNIFEWFLDFVERAAPPKAYESFKNLSFSKLTENITTKMNFKVLTEDSRKHKIESEKAISQNFPLSSIEIQDSTKLANK